MPFDKPLNMEKVKVKLKGVIDNSYEIIIGEGLLESLAGNLKNKPIASKYVIITDSNVEKFYGKALLKDFKEKNMHCRLISFQAGEKSKTRATKEKIEDKMLKLALDRSTCIIALGGGVVGDIAGFVAATYLRGIPYMQVPTTLLAQVDSSVGGKVGINAHHAKNSIGAFYQPKKVIIDINLLKTLPKNELLNGVSEIIKYGLISDKRLFEFLEMNIDKIFDFDPKSLMHIIRKSCEIKSLVVSEDEKERGLRRILNYGHTIGHAVESASNYEISHGEAVAMGMHYSSKLSVKLGYLEEGSFIRQTNLVNHLGFKQRISQIKLKPRQILRNLQYDKKILNGRINFVFLNSIGDAFISDNVTMGDIKNVLGEK